MIYFFARPVRKLKILESKARFETRETTNRMDTQQTFDFVANNHLLPSQNSNTPNMTTKKFILQLLFSINVTILTFN